MEFNEIETPLRQLLIDFGPQRSSYHPEYPFWRLQSEGIWEVMDGASLPRRASNTDPPITVLRERRVRAGFVQPLHDALRRSPDEIELLADHVARTHLGDHKPEVLARLGFETG